MTLDRDIYPYGVVLVAVVSTTNGVLDAVLSTGGVDDAVEVAVSTWTVGDVFIFNCAGSAGASQVPGVVMV